MSPPPSKAASADSSAATTASLLRSSRRGARPRQAPAAISRTGERSESGRKDSGDGLKSGASSAALSSPASAPASSAASRRTASSVSGAWCVTRAQLTAASMASCGDALNQATAGPMRASGSASACAGSCEPA